MAECAPDQTEHDQVDHDSQAIQQRLKDAKRAAERGGGSGKGKRISCPSSSRRDDDDDDDCRVIEVFDVMPISYAHAYLVSETTAGTSKPAAADRGKKRAAEELAAEMKKKIKKTSARKTSSARPAAVPSQLKQRPVGVGLDTSLLN